MTTPASYHPADPESVFTYGAPQLKYGPGAAEEIGYDLSLTGARRVLVVTDPGIAATGTPQRLAEHHDLRARRPLAQGQDRHQLRAAAPDHGGRRPVADAVAAGRRHRG